jgi:hypothetical protein
MSIDGLKNRAIGMGIPFRKGKTTHKLLSRLKLPKKETDLAYLAALLDGEGYITISYGKRTLIRVGIANTCVPVIKWLCSIGGGVSPVKVEGNRKPCFHWSIAAKLEVRDFLRAVLPYMRMKQDKAKIAIDLIQENVGQQEQFRKNALQSDLQAIKA